MTENPMGWPMDVFRDHILDLPMVMAEANGHRDYSKPPPWVTGVVSSIEAMKKFGMKGYWNLEND